MRIALTGTPGVGKTTLARLLASRGRRVTTVDALARLHGDVVGRDEEDDADVVDVERLAQRHLPADMVVDGHLSHLLPVDVVWLLRLDPRTLRARLEARGYAPPKVQENVEAEAMDLILQEALSMGCPVVQRDATGRSAEELLQEFERVGARHDLESVDWSDRLLDHGP